MRWAKVDIIKLYGTGFASNTYLLISGGEAAVVDPSAHIEEIMKAAGEARIRYVLLTHGHFDHILSLDELCARTGAEVLIHEGDIGFPKDFELNASAVFGLNIASSVQMTGLAGGERIPLGQEEIAVISLPGHTPGSVCYDCGEVLICGDTLFPQGYGRYDLPCGNAQRLYASLKVLADIGVEKLVHPGHGASFDLSSAVIIRAIRNNNFSLI